jgi:hypothetical protein
MPGSVVSVAQPVVVPGSPGAHLPHNWDYRIGSSTRFASSGSIGPAWSAASASAPFVGETAAGAMPST